MDDDKFDRWLARLIGFSVVLGALWGLFLLVAMIVGIVLSVDYLLSQQ